ncbi:5' nucleotidase, NT5C type [Desulfitobacterium chlororespirans]|uniref:Nucleotidase n=1 Tax=Desulfitobacterium chlororespirans DSM 11544 TaxID=1121395 RepID=A0A1M7RTF0_9FIRM|nr:hypothetical protein [Desulfitobacterium chlororespirans]SHN49406.1 hypothetical protein SAMN02745215_00062 [Desulfitobacterium chlororespirans DSM 11544]
MRIGVDIDGVVSDSYKAWLRKLNRHFGTNILELKNYDMHLDFGVSWEEMGKYFEDNVATLFDIPDPVAGAKEGIERLLRQGHEVVYVTARSLDEEVHTLRWMKKHKIPHEQILFTSFQSKVDYVLQWQLEIFLEDFLGNAQAISEAGVPVLLLDASYNQGELSSGIIRCQDWREIVREIGRRTPFSRSATM